MQLPVKNSYPMKEKVNVLVCGCGGDIGQSIGKILCESDYVGNLYGCDISVKNAARFIYPNYLPVIPCSDPDYLKNLIRLIEEKNLQVVIPVSEPELRYFFGQNLLDQIADADVLIASAKALKTGFDKIETASFLRREALSYPFTCPISMVDNINKFPVIIKPSSGSGSRNVYIVDDSETFSFLKMKHPDFIVQEYLEGEFGEYTCGLFQSSRGTIRTIIFKRELMAGFSVYGEVVANEEVETLLHQIAKGLELTGSINVQLKLTKKGPIVFEINPRFSSTVRFRHLLGFKDVEWTLEDKLKLPLSDYIKVRPGRKFYKGFNEYIE
jgi:carbamoyl-phosphate synthase large subunit